MTRSYFQTLAFFIVCIHQAASIQDKYESFGFRHASRSESSLWPAQLGSIGTSVLASKDVTQNDQAGSNPSHAPAEVLSSIKPANNNPLASSLHHHRQILTNVDTNQGQAGTNSPGVEFNSQVFSVVPDGLELALRQANGDESVFQPSPPIGAPGHTGNFDWLTQSPGDLSKLDKPRQQAPNDGGANSAFKNGNVEKTNEPTRSSLQTTAPAETSSKTAELNNNVLNQAEPIILDHQQSVSSSHQSQPVLPFSPHLGRDLRQDFQNLSSAIEFSNQVIYEGPATVPPSTNDYYYLANNNRNIKNNILHNERVSSNAWWAIGVGGEFEKVSNLTKDNYLEYCEQSPLLINNKQRSLCRAHHRIMPIVARGLKMAIDECQRKFANNRWNCSVMLRDDLVDQPNNDYSKGNNPLLSASKQSQIFGDFMEHPNRERSFLNAIFAAGLAHSMTKACSQGELPEECNCDRKIKSKSNKGRIEWVACSDDIDYGARFSREFTDNFDLNELDATTTIYMHNSEVGRRIFKSATDITCTCSNGENGLCQIKRCWKHLGPFTDLVDEIIKRYEGATHVQRSNRDPHKLRPVKRGVRKPKRRDLVYIDESPDYCQRDIRIGVLGTQNRLCNSTSHGPDSCSLLCCGRGFQSVVEHIEGDCNCKFVWCCQVKCERCSRYVTNDICN